VGLPVLGGNEPRIYSSTDGMTWTTRNLPRDPHWIINLWDVTFGGGQFVAVGDQLIATSTNGIDWSSQFIDIAGGSLQAVAYGDGQYVALGLLGTVLTSTDGMDWSAHGPGMTGFRKVRYDSRHGQYIAVGDRGLIAVSQNGESWTRAPSLTQQTLWDVTMTDTAYVAVGGLTAGIVLTSPSGDGLSWTVATDQVNVTLTGVLSTPDFLIAVGPFGSVFTAPNDAPSNWTRRTVGLVSGTLHCIIYDGTQYIAAGVGGVVLKSDCVPRIASVTALTNPVRLKIRGTNFHRNCSATIGTTAVATSWGNQRIATAKKCKELVPKGQSVYVTITNPDDGRTSPPYAFTR
jgi:hypothetical protein